MTRILLTMMMLAITVSGCQRRKKPTSVRQEGSQEMTIALSSSTFEEGGTIPPKYTCDGEDMSPPLKWEGIPEGTRSIALISDDPDAPMGTWVHWVMWNIPPEARGLPEHVPPDPQLPDGSHQGITDFGRPGYGGPCPPSGTHRYYFKVYALGTTLDLPTSARKADLLKAVEGHVLAEGQLMGRYSRQ
jgi:Raf kinase inhibitor-like YbhB/YbcL family protein